MITTLANSVLSVVLAPVCAGCSAVLATPLNGCVCRNCWASILPAGPLDNVELDPGSPLSGLISVGAYDGTLRDIIHALKYQGRRSIARHLAVLMRWRGRDLLTGADCVIPVPLHWRREYSRGFNQAREIARHLGPPVVDALVRSRATTSQIALSADQRHANVQGAFEVKPASRWRAARSLDGCVVVLVDDVVTTGATLEACAVVLKAAGAEEVSGLTAARKL